MNAKSHDIKSSLGKLDAHNIEPDEFDEIPELTAEDFARPDLVWHVDGKAVSKNEGINAFSASMKKQKISIAIDPDVVAWFKSSAGGRGYQSLINAALREAMQRKTIEETIRRVIKEELHSV
ncbi:BrnA antitoxin family protein [Sulfuriferula nivalis]|uniref:BrnA antitoxin family protein n=1 Tax=Sulfuriferula nivalis TaxID=2675298 RepID=A0A809S731_9PROT|nr:BrnA antitoxin family protein [Sulfuriferula nivalis]BBO99482.1 hypothetical protein SFSGTM_01910 [Sulfuriferula nivalis]